MCRHISARAERSVAGKSAETAVILVILNLVLVNVFIYSMSARFPVAGIEELTNIFFFFRDSFSL